VRKKKTKKSKKSEAEDFHPHTETDDQQLVVMQSKDLNNRSHQAELYNDQEKTRNHNDIERNASLEARLQQIQVNLQN
jgi:hypothetical protein